MNSKRGERKLMLLKPSFLIRSLGGLLPPIASLIYMFLININMVTNYERSL